MPTVYLRKDLYDQIVKHGKDVNVFVNRIIEEELWKQEKPKEKPKSPKLIKKEE